MSVTNKAVQVGVGVWIMHMNKVLIGKRIGSHGAGHLEFGETFQECAIREALEETGLDLDPATAKFVTANNNIMSDIDRHYVTIFVAANTTGKSDAKVMEPLKCERWEWITREQIMDDAGPYRPLFSPLAKMVKEYDLGPLFDQGI
ncbi:Nudix hydrolase 15, mitochondrial [Mortierella sp. AM989]|nr:Nudix hydrolase 15, mitochondrial [Mortierella sp. AM989]